MIANNKKIIELKRIINEIVQEEKSQTGIEFQVEPLTIIEYYKSPVFKDKLILTKIANTIATNGFYNAATKNICVYLRYRKMLNFPKGLASVIKTTFHEIRHVQQFNKEEPNKYMTYNEFIISIEKVIKILNGKDYILRHEQYFYEIDANLYAVNKTIEYLKNNNLLTDENRSYLELKLKEYELDYESFDVQLVLKKFHDICKKNKVCTDNWFEQIFYNEDMKSFKSISEILSNPNINRIDRKILVDIISSEHFLKSLDFSKLSEHEKDIITNALNETYETQIKRRNNCIDMLHKGIIDGKKWLALDSAISNKIAYCTNAMIIVQKLLNSNFGKIKVLSHYNTLSKIVEEQKNEYE